jgi:nucleotide-binding universal stress UspA family protein
MSGRKSLRERHECLTFRMVLQNRKEGLDPMMKGILVGIDGSSFGESALELAIRWGRRFDALVVGLGVLDEPNIHRAEALPIGATHYKSMQGKARFTEAQKKVDRLLESFALRCAKEQVAFKPLEDVGDPAAQFELESQRYDIVLLGKETHFEFATTSRPDDTLVKVLRQGSRPLVVAPLVNSESGRVAIAYDGSVQSARALQSFQASGLASHRDVHLITVAESRLAAARIADRGVEFLSLHGHSAHAVPLESSGQPADVILKQVDQIDAELLVMGAFGKPSLREFFLGTVTRLVLHRATVPVFLYH